MQAVRSLGLRSVLPLLAALLFVMPLAPASAALLPRDPDIPVSGTTFLACPAVAMSENGAFEVVWNHPYSEAHAIPQGIFARHFDSQGRPTDAKEIRLDSPGSLEASGARVVALPGAGYFVSWFEVRQSRTSLLGRFLSPAGRPRGSVLRLARNGSPVALVVVDDSLIVAWSEPDSTLRLRLRARRFDFQGRALGEAMLLAANVGPGRMDVAPFADGFVAAWPRWDGRSWNIVAQRFSLDGEPLGAALRVNENRIDGIFGAWVTSNGFDRFAVAWTTKVLRPDPQTGQQVFDDEARARLFDLVGASGPEVHPNQLDTGNQQASGLAMNDRGVALVTWSSDRNSAASSLDVAGRFLDADGQPASRAFPISRNVAGVDFCPAAASNGEDVWVVAWLKQGTGIFARRLVFTADSAPED